MLFSEETDESKIEKSWTGTDEIVCPICNYSYDNSWELQLDDNQPYVLQCESCGKDFQALGKMIYETSEVKHEVRRN